MFLLLVLVLSHPEGTKHLREWEARTSRVRVSGDEPPLRLPVGERAVGDSGERLDLGVGEGYTLSDTVPDASLFALLLVLLLEKASGQDVEVGSHLLALLPRLLPGVDRS